MTPRPRKEAPPVTLESLPYKLRMDIVKVMADSYIDFDEALEKAAVLIDQNSKAFKDAVSKEAQSQYKSRFMREVNNTRTTIQRKADRDISNQYQEAYDAGYLQGKQDNAIWYFCAICNKMTYMKPNAPDHKAMINYMRQDGWSHGSCYEKKKKGG